MANAKFIYIADVYCPWCFAFGPIMKRLAEEHPDFEVNVYGGNLMSQPTSLNDLSKKDPGLIEFWRQVETASGRSLAGAIEAVREQKNIELSSPKADIILEALKSLAPGHTLDQLLALEDVFYAKGQNLFDPAALSDLATRWNLKPEKLQTAVNSQQIKKIAASAYEDALRLMNGIDSYPTLLLQKDSKVDAVSRGFVHYETVAARLENAMLDLGLEEQPDKQCSWHAACTIGRHDK